MIGHSRETPEQNPYSMKTKFKCGAAHVLTALVKGRDTRLSGFSIPLRARFATFLVLLTLGAGLRAAGSPLTGATPTGLVSEGWSSLGAMPKPSWDGKTLLFHSEQGTLAVSPLSGEIIRVRFARGNNFGRDHSYAVINRGSGTPAVKTEIGSTAATLATLSLKITIQYAPLRISFANDADEILNADDAALGISVARRYAAPGSRWFDQK